MKPTIRAMQVREAKDFLVVQTAEQAALDGAPLSDLEKRMMYFTESDDAVEDPGQLNDEFEAKYDSTKYEAKISRLLHRAYLRAKKENLHKVATWSEAIRVLRKGDHYILVLWGEGPTRRGPSKRPLWKWVLILLILTLAGFARPFMGYLMNTSARPAHPQLLLIIFLGIIAATLIFPAKSNKQAAGFWHFSLS